ncbi:hypothetical protein [Pseudodesulfovibrio sediminis]|uniref:Uncharacterized protein n=1 Tax=Pseudodesulfovibrio sediminis TaxID=2810563 RepID=A0ABM7P791_9BACT|nr:hypothetical protein [Pseudodesulfovibrio sediminis]BCS88794.1 hypothetical protein PSDVSF_20360 [Pseudodesulfovibrio sediminis]
MKQRLEEKVVGLGDSAEENMKEMIRQGVDPEVAQELLNDEQYQEYLVRTAKLEAEYHDNPKQFLEKLGIPIKDGETAEDIEQKADLYLRWLSSLSDNEIESEDPTNTVEHDNDLLEGLTYKLQPNGAGKIELKIGASETDFTSHESIGILLSQIDSNNDLEYNDSSLKAGIMQCLLNGRRFIDSIPADDMNKAQAALLGMQLASGGPVKVMIGYSVAMAFEAVAGDSIEQGKDYIAQEVAILLLAGDLTNEEFKQINCPDGDCSDKSASTGSYLVDFNKDNVKFGVNIIAGTVGSIISKKVSVKLHKNPLTAKIGDVIATPKSHRELFNKLPGGRWQHKKSGAIYKKSTSAHTGKSGEWKISLKKGQGSRKSKKITIDLDGTVLGIDK